MSDTEVEQASSTKHTYKYHLGINCIRRPVVCAMRWLHIRGGTRSLIKHTHTPYTASAPCIPRRSVGVGRKGSIYRSERRNSILSPPVKLSGIRTATVRIFAFVRPTVVFVTIDTTNTSFVRRHLNLVGRFPAIAPTARN